MTDNSTVRFGSVCSGIEAASVAWRPLGWEATWFSEIEPFPCAVLAYHYPGVPNLGDMTTLPPRIRSGEVEAPEVFCGGTPCQAFSVAGMRRSLDDARGNLSLTFVEIADAVDAVRGARGKLPAIIFWENVPGVLSTNDNAFGCFLAGLAGEDVPLEPPRGRWSNAGAVFGPSRAIAWRVLDAQHFGLAQRRKRVFVVASARDGFDPTAVLFEFHGVRRDTAPSREARETAPTIPSRSTAGGGLGTDFNVDGGLLDVQVAGCLTAGFGKMGAPEIDAYTAIPVHHAVAHSLRGEGFDASEDGTGRGTPLVPVAFSAKDYGGDAMADLSPTLRAGGHNASHANAGVMPAIAFHPTQDPISSTDVCHSIGANENATAAVAVSMRESGQGYWMEDVVAGTIDANMGMSGHAHRPAVIAQPVAHAFDASQSDVIQYGDRTGPLDTSGHSVAVAVAFHENQRGELTVNDTAGALKVGGGKPGQGYPAVARPARPIDPYLGGEITIAIDASYAKGCGGTSVAERPVVAHAMQVRRLTPVECERLQGFPDGYTAIPWRKKPASECPDGPRYKALGNSWAVPVVRWVGRRIDGALKGAKLTGGEPPAA